MRITYVGFIMRKISVSRDDSCYECFPDVTRAHDGRLICVYRESASHVPLNYTRLVVRQSLDDGETWGERNVLSESIGSVSKKPGWNCPRISQLSDGRGVIACDKILWPENRQAYRVSEVYLWWSEDFDSWEGPNSTGSTGIVPHKVKELRHGELILGTHDRSQVTGSLRQLLWRSEEGTCWEGPTTVADVAGKDLCEGSFIESGDVLVCIMRENSGLGLPGYKSLSLDQGATWEGPLPTPLPGCHRPVAGWWGGEVFVTFRCFMGRGIKNTMLMGAALDPSGVFSLNAARQRGRLFPIDYDRSPEPDTGYTGWCELDNEDIYLVNYIVDDAPTAQIRGYRISPEDVLVT